MMISLNPNSTWAGLVREKAARIRWFQTSNGTYTAVAEFTIQFCRCNQDPCGCKVWTEACRISDLPVQSASVNGCLDNMATVCINKLLHEIEVAKEKLASATATLLEYEHSLSNVVADVAKLSDPVN